MTRSPGLFIAALFILVHASGCAILSKKDNPAIDKILDVEVGDLDSSLAEKIMSSPLPKKTKQQNEMHHKVRWWLRYDSVNDHARFQRNIDRGEAYRPMVQQILRHYQLPPELYFLALIESSFVNHAVSSANAVGIWQFMKPTALNYGLKVHGSIDERKDPIAATHAAARYLLFLHHKFKSWYLAIAAFNAGQGRISEAIRKGRTDNFWKLVERKLIPKETMEYIPKFIAAATIGDNLKKFDFTIPTANHPWPEVAQVEFKTKKVRAKFNPSDIARLTGIDEVTLKRMNPYSFKSAHQKRIKLWVPKDYVSHLISIQAASHRFSVVSVDKRYPTTF